MPNFTTTNRDVIDSVNYLLAGPNGIGQSIKGYYNSDGGYLLNSRSQPYLASSPLATPVPFDSYAYTPAILDVTVDNDTDTVLISAQARPYIQWTYTINPSEFNTYISIERIDLPYQTTIIELAQDNNLINNSNMSIRQQNGDDSILDTIYVGITDQPGRGVWRYLMTFYSILSAGDPVINWYYVENLGITTTLIKQ